MTEDPKGGPSKDGDLAAARQEIEEVFRRGSEFVQELLRENERLRYRVAELESRSGGGADDALVRELIEKVSRLESERDEMRRLFQEVEEENRSFAHRYVEIEAENNNLLNIYVASHQLHSTVDFDEVVQIITEIILNFIGAEVFAVGLLDEKVGGLHPVVLEGVTPAQLRREGRVVEALESGEPYFAQDLQQDPAAGPVACVPMTIRGQTIGVLIIYRFLQQKQELRRVDHELFGLLAGHAATALFAAKLYSDSQRKLNTIQGLIDLVAS